MAVGQCECDSDSVREWERDMVVAKCGRDGKQTVGASLEKTNVCLLVGGTSEDLPKSWFEEITEKQS